MINVLYIIFILADVKHTSEIELKETSPAENGDRNGSHDPASAATQVEEKSKGFLREFFDPTVVNQLWDVISRRRKFYGQIILFLMLALLFFSAGVTQGKN